MSRIDQVIIRTPEQAAFRNPTVILSQRELRAWLNALPLLKPLPTVQQLFDAIDACNRESMPPKKRLPLLQEYRSVLLQINPSLDQHALKRLPLSEQEREHLQSLTVGMCKSLAEGYKLMIKHALQEGTAHKAEILFEPLYLAMEAQSLAILNCYRAYRSVPQHLYQDIHQLYLLAEHTGILAIETEPDKHSLSAGSIGGIYRQTMTLALLDPYHLPPGVVEKLYERLSRLCVYCKALDTIPATASEHIWVTDLSSDSPPMALYRVAAPESLKIARAFDLQPMTAGIQQQIQSLQAEQQGLSVRSETELLNRLIPASKAQKTRKAERTNSDRLCKVTFGIDAVHYFLSLQKKELQQALDSNADRFGPHLLETWQMINESDSGLSLGSKQLTRHDVRVGDIIGLLAESRHEPGYACVIAIVRWIRNEREQHINIGIEFIDGNLLPAICRLTDGPSTNNTFAAIFVSSQSLGGTPATLITPKRVYQRGRIIHVTVGDQPLRIKAGFLRDDTFCFDRFDFSSINA